MDDKYHEENYQYEDLVKEKQLEEARETMDGIREQDERDQTKFLTRFVVEKLVDELNQRLDFDPDFISLYREDVAEINEAIKILDIDTKLNDPYNDPMIEDIIKFTEYDPCQLCPKNSITENAPCDDGAFCPYIGHERIGHEGSK